MPVTPPNVKRTIKETIHHKIGSLFLTLDFNNMYNHVNTFMPVGTPIIIVTELKKTAVLTSRPTVNM